MLFLSAKPAVNWLTQAVVLKCYPASDPIVLPKASQTSQINILPDIQHTSLCFNFQRTRKCKFKLILEENGDKRINKDERDRV